MPGFGPEPRRDAVAQTNTLRCPAALGLDERYTDVSTEVVFANQPHYRATIRRRKFSHVSACFIVSGLRFDVRPLDLMNASARRG